MKKFGLIGHPIGHSVSPAVFSAGYKGRPYVYDLIEGEDFEESYRRFIESYDGINVTAPFKEPAFARADLHSPECEIIGATNLLVKTPEGVKAYNTDYYGAIFSILLGFGVNVEGFPATPSAEFCRATLNSLCDPSAKAGLSEPENALAGRTGMGFNSETGRERATGLKKALIVGCGGAGKAAVVAAVNLGFETTLMNRTIDKAFAVAERITSASGKATTAGVGMPNPAGTSSALQTSASVQTPADPAARLIVRPIEDFIECFAQSELVIYTLPCPIAALKEIANIPAEQTAAPTHLNTTDNSATDVTGKSTPKYATERETASTCHASKVIIEANYRDPAFTPEFIAKIQTRFPEAEFIRGNIWHLHQAWSGYILFTGEIPDLPAMAAVDK